MVDTPGKMLRAISAESSVKLSVIQLLTCIGVLIMAGFSMGGMYFKFDSMQEDMHRSKIEDTEWKQRMGSDMSNLQKQVFLLQLAATGAPQQSQPTSGFPNISRGNP